MRQLRSRSCSTIRILCLSALGAVLVLGACRGRGARREAPVAPSTRPPLERPDEVLLEGSIGELAQLRGAVPAEVGAALPESAAALLEGVCARLPPAVAARVGAEERGVFVLLRRTQHENLDLALGVRVRLDEGTAPLGAGVALGVVEADRAPAGGRWVGGVPATNRSALALLGDVLVCAQNADAARTGGPYLARTLVPAAAGGARLAGLRAPPQILGAPFVAQVVPRAIAREARAWADASLATVGADLGGSARRAVAAHSTSPVLGDPVALVEVLRARLGQLAAYLPDVGAVRATVAPGGGGLVVSIRAEVAGGSPLATALDALPTAETRTLGALPRGTALAALFAAEPADARTEWSFGAGLADDLARVAGARLSAQDATKVRDVLADLGASRGTALIAALGHGLAGPFAFVVSGGAPSAPAPAKLTAALGTTYVRGAVGLALGCSGEASARPLSAPLAFGGAALRMLDLCDARAPVALGTSTPRSPRLDHAARDGAWALSVTQLSTEPAGTPRSSIAARVVGGLAGVDDGPSLASDPDSAHALAALPPRAYFALAILPEQLLAAAAFLPVDVLARAAREAGEASPGPPLLLALTRDDGALRLELVLPASALARAAEARAAASALSR